MNGQEVRKLTDEEISIEIRTLRSKLHTLRTQVVTDKVEDVSSFKQARRDVARLLTERNARLFASGKRTSKRRRTPANGAAPGAAGRRAPALKTGSKAPSKASAKTGSKGVSGAAARPASKRTTKRAAQKK